MLAPGFWSAHPWWLQRPSDVRSPSTIGCHSSAALLVLLLIGKLAGVALQVVYHALEAFWFPFTLWCIHLLDSINYLWIYIPCFRGEKLPKNLHSLVLNCILSGWNFSLLLWAVSGRLRTARSWFISLFCVSWPKYHLLYLWHLALSLWLHLVSPGGHLSWLTDQMLAISIWIFPRVCWMLSPLSSLCLIGPSSSLTWHPSE